LPPSKHWEGEADAPHVLIFFFFFADPFNRQPLNIGMVEPVPELKEK
jgi:hypothetical protein